MEAVLQVQQARNGLKESTCFAGKNRGDCSGRARAWTAQAPHQYPRDLRLREPAAIAGAGLTPLKPVAVSFV